MATTIDFPKIGATVKVAITAGDVLAGSPYDGCEGEIIDFYLDNETAEIVFVLDLGSELFNAFRTEVTVI